MTGQDVVKWLTTKGNIGSTREAEAIGEALVNAGLLIPVVMGLYSTVPARLGPVSTWEVPGPLLCNSPTYIYIYPGTSSVSNRPRAIYTLFGDIISTSISAYTKRSNAVPTSGAATGSVNSSEANTEAYVEYQIQVSNSTEEWTVFRRYVSKYICRHLFLRYNVFLYALVRMYIYINMHIGTRSLRFSIDCCTARASNLEKRCVS